MDKEKLLKFAKKRKNSNQVEIYYKCVQKIVKSDPQYYYNKEYAKSFINKEI